MTMLIIRADQAGIRLTLLLGHQCFNLAHILAYLAHEDRDFISQEIEPVELLLPGDNFLDERVVSGV